MPLKGEDLSGCRVPGNKTMNGNVCIMLALVVKGPFYNIRRPGITNKLSAEYPPLANEAFVEAVSDLHQT